MTVEQQQIEPSKAAFVQLAGKLDDLEKHFKLFQEVKTKLLNKDTDIELIGDKEFIKKTGWVKLAVAFNLSTMILSENKVVDAKDPTKYAYHFTVACRASNGRTVEEVGSCDNTEKPDAEEHIIRAMAKTRATSRAISAMIGNGEPSAEEMSKSTQKPKSGEVCRCDFAQMSNNAGMCGNCNKPLTKGQIDALAKHK